MKISKALPILSLGCLFAATSINAQERPIGYWRSHLPYNTAVGVATDGTTAFVATEQSFYTNNVVTGEITPYSKVEGMSDVGMAAIGYDPLTETVILAYTNSNIDLFKDGSFFNIPDLKNKTVTGTKKINHIYTENGLAYLSTDIGIVVINLDKKEVKETFTFTKNRTTIPVTGLTAAGNSFYASTTKGVYSIDKDNPRTLDFSAWTALDTVKSLISVSSVQDKVFVTGIDSLYSIDNNTLSFIYRSDSSTKHLDPGADGVWITENYSSFTGGVKKMGLNYTLIDSFKTPGYGQQSVELPSGKVWVADLFNGLSERGGKNTETYNTVKPEGPSTFSVFDIYAYNKELLIAHGGYTEKWQSLNNKGGFSNFNSEKWKSYKVYDYQPFGDSVFDISNIIKGPEGNVYAGSFQDGLFIQKPDGSYEYYKQNSILDVSITSGDAYLVSGLAMDNSGNLWLTMFGGRNQLVVKTKEGNWYKYDVPSSSPIQNAAANLIIDDNNQKWFVSPLGGGIVVFDDNSTPDNPNDDRSRQLLSGKGRGGLPNSDVFCLAKDKNGAIWVGTADGIGIINCPGQVIEGKCESELRVVQFDEFAGNLFQNEQVRAIAVDGANRKWIGTNNGVWLISPEGDKIISRFTAENSPLPSDRVQKITIDPITGDVYFGTELGLISYRGTATEGTTENQSVITYPNPVPSGYTGTIAIRGLTENADVRITDIAGQLVYRTKALGGQAVWNGLDYTGRRPQTGVYLIFVTNRDGSQTHVGKLMLME